MDPGLRSRRAVLYSSKQLLRKLMLLLLGTSTTCALMNDGDDLLDEIPE